MALRLFNGMARTFLLAGLALKVIFSPVKGFTPSRAFVAGFLTTLSLSRPGMVKRPLLRRLFLMTPLSESNTVLTCLRDRPVSFEMDNKISDLVGAPPFFAICSTPYKHCVSERRNGARNIESARKIAHA